MRLCHRKECVYEEKNDFVKKKKENGWFNQAKRQSLRWE